MSSRQLILVGLILGATAAALVWWLERFEVARLHAELDDYMGRHAGFAEWLRDHGGEGEGPPVPA